MGLTRRVGPSRSPRSEGEGIVCWRPTGVWFDGTLEQDLDPRGAGSVCRGGSASRCSAGGGEVFSFREAETSETSAPFVQLSRKLPERKRLSSGLGITSWQSSTSSTSAHASRRAPGRDPGSRTTSWQSSTSSTYSRLRHPPVTIREPPWPLRTLGPFGFQAGAVGEEKALVRAPSCPDSSIRFRSADLSAGRRRLRE